MTQLQLAEYLNYSDKSVSKWEHADGMPDVYVLHRIAGLYKIEISDLLSTKKRKRPGSEKKKKAFIMSLASVLVAVIAAVVFAFGYFISNEPRFFLAFVYAVPVAAIVSLVLASVWKMRVVSGIATSVIIWGSFACIATTIFAITGDLTNFWVFVTIAVPLQLLTVLWFFFRETLQRARNAFIISFEKSRVKSREKREERENKKQAKADAAEPPDGDAPSGK